MAVLEQSQTEAAHYVWTISHSCSNRLPRIDLVHLFIVRPEKVQK